MDEVRIESITKSYGTTMAVVDFDLTVSQGEYVFILGPNACGKSVLLRMIAGLETPTNGTIYIRDQPVNDVPAYKRNIPVVFQNFALFPAMTARQNIEYGMKIKKIPVQQRREKSDRMLEMLGLLDMSEKKPSQLSAGQRQRVGLGRALVQDSHLLLLDEPLGALDATLHVRMQFELKRLQGELGLTFIQVSHNHSDALAVADRIVIMNRGRIEQVGTPWEVFSRPCTRFAAEILENNNLFEGAVLGHDDHAVLVETNLGQFSVPAEGSLPPNGTHVAFVVRQDQVLIDPENCRNTLSARLTSRTVKGSLVIYGFAANGMNLKVERHLSYGLMAAGEKKTYTLGWAMDSSHLLPYD